MMRRIVFLLIIITLSYNGVNGQSNAPAADPGLTVHVVQRGENLFRIALQYGLTTDQVAQANGITNPSSILVGQRLIIPLNGLPVEVEQPREHIVKPGESFSSIAGFYGMDVNVLASINNLTLGETLYAGQRLLVDAISDSQEETSIVHQVLGGETLFSIAQHYGTTVADIQTANDMAGSSVIYAGQELIVPGVSRDEASPELLLDLPGAVASIDVSPLVLAEGGSGRVRLQTTTPATILARFADREVVVNSDLSRTVHMVLIGIPVFTTPGIYPLSFDVAPEGAPAESVTVNVQVVAGAYGSQSISISADKAHLLSAAVEDNEMNILKSVMGGFSAERYFDGPFSLPAAAVMNSPFGTRRSYNGGAFDHYHSGADFAGAAGTPVFAAAPGKVVLADTLHIRGNTVVIDHGWGVYTLYAHMSERYVSLGETVSTGQTIGAVGSTGRATGAHLHWELWLNGVPVNPMQWTQQNFS